MSRIRGYLVKDYIQGTHPDTYRSVLLGDANGDGFQGDLGDVPIKNYHLLWYPRRYLVATDQEYVLDNLE
jgi:hypothetical protein